MSMEDNIQNQQYNPDMEGGGFFTNFGRATKTMATGKITIAKPVEFTGKTININEKKSRRIY